jgi:hypothetical protein
LHSCGGRHPSTENFTYAHVFNRQQVRVPT